MLLPCSHSFPSPTHSFIPGLKPPFSVNPSHRSLSFLPQDAMHAQYQPRACFRLSVCLCVTSRCTTKTAKHRITQRKQHDSSRILVFFTKDLCKIRPGSPPTGTPNAGGVGQNRRLSTNSWLYLENGRLQDRRMVSITVEVHFALLVISS